MYKRSWDKRTHCMCRGGLTLLEVVLSLGLMFLLLGGVFFFYASGLRAREEGGRLTREVNRMRAELLRMAEDIRHAVNLVPGDGEGFSGTEDSITIVRLAMPDMAQAFQRLDPETEELPPAQTDIARLKYMLVWSDDLEDDEGVRLCYGLWRSQQKAFDPNPKFVIETETEAGEESTEGPSSEKQRVFGELIAPEIKYLKFEYFDGAEWRDRWSVAVPDQEGQEGSEGEASESDENASDESDAEGDDESDAEGAEGTGAASDGNENRSDEYVLPQAVKITIGKVRVKPEEDEFDISQLKETEERRDRELHHSDRLTMIVYLPHADQTLLSSRKFGMKEKLGRDEEGL